MSIYLFTSCSLATTLFCDLLINGKKSGNRAFAPRLKLKLNSKKLILFLFSVMSKKISLIYKKNVVFLFEKALVTLASDITFVSFIGVNSCDQLTKTFRS